MGSEFNVKDVAWRRDHEHRLKTRKAKAEVLKNSLNNFTYGFAVIAINPYLAH